MLITRISSNDFNASMLIVAFSFVVFGLLFNASIDNIKTFYHPDTWATVIGVITYILDGAGVILLIFTGVRALIETSSE